MSGKIEAVFGEPISQVGRTRKVRRETRMWIKAAENLRSKPGEWAQLKVYPRNADYTKAHSTKNRLTNGLQKGFPKGEFEFVIGIPLHKLEGHAVFGRYVGGVKEDDLSRLSMMELRKLCQNHGVKVARSRMDTIARLTSFLNNI